MESNVLQKRWVQGGNVVVDDLRGTMFTGENGAHTFQISGVDSAQEAVAITGTITGRFLTATNVTVPLTGSVSDGVASLTLTEDCYVIPGRFVLSIYATNGSTTQCIYCAVGNVFRTQSDIIEYPSASIPDIEQIIADAQAAVTEINAEVTDAQAAVAAAQTAVDGIEAQKDTMIASIASVAGQGTDTTLTQSGVAADAKAAGDQISDLKSQLGNLSSLETTDKTSAVDAINEIYGMFTGDVGEAVADWLDDHPEATTTVQDHSLSQDKLIIGTMGYVTPEMYGAKGDGVTYDTTAFQSAINSGKPVLAFGNYKTDSPLTIGKLNTVIRCYGNINYVGSTSAIVLTTSDCNIYIKSITSNATGIELRPTGGNTHKLNNCSNNVIKADDIKCLSGYGLYLNANSGYIQFSTFDINSIRGEYETYAIRGINIVATDTTERYVNANAFNVNSISYTGNALVIVSNSQYSCIDNVFNNPHFEDNTYSINFTNAKAAVYGARFDGESYGRIEIHDGVSCEITLSGTISENIAFGSVPTTTNSRYHIIGTILDRQGYWLCNELYITKYGYYAPGITTPVRNSMYSLSGLYSDKGVGYLNANSTLHLPSVGLSGYGNPLQEYTYYYTAETRTGTQSIQFSDESTQSVNWTTFNGMIKVTPRENGSGQRAVVYPMAT